MLSGVQAGASRTTGGILVGLRHDLFSRGERPALAVKQVYQWLCHTALYREYLVNCRARKQSIMGVERRQI